MSTGVTGSYYSGLARSQQSVSHRVDGPLPPLMMSTDVSWAGLTYPVMPQPLTPSGEPISHSALYGAELNALGFFPRTRGHQMNSADCRDSEGVLLSSRAKLTNAYPYQPPRRPLSATEPL